MSGDKKAERFIGRLVRNWVSQLEDLHTHIRDTYEMAEPGNLPRHDWIFRSNRGLKH